MILCNEKAQDCLFWIGLKFTGTHEGDENTITKEETARKLATEPLKLFGAAFESWREGDLTPERASTRDMEAERLRSKAAQRAEVIEMERASMMKGWRDALVRDRIKHSRFEGVHRESSEARPYPIEPSLSDISDADSTARSTVPADHPVELQPIDSPPHSPACRATQLEGWERGTGQTSRGTNFSALSFRLFDNSQD